MLGLFGVRQASNLSLIMVSNLYIMWANMSYLASIHEIDKHQFLHSFNLNRGYSCARTCNDKVQEFNSPCPVLDADVYDGPKEMIL